MLKRFSVTNFRNFRNKITFDLSDVRDYKFNRQYIRNGTITNAAVFGRNATGKTNLGRALMDVRENFSGRPLGSPRPDDDEWEDPLFLNADAACDVATFEYVFELAETEVAYRYEKDAAHTLRHELLSVDGQVAFSFNNQTGTFEAKNLRLIGADALNLQFADEFVGMLSYITNSLPATQGTVIRDLRSFVRDMGLYGSARRFDRFYHVNLRRIARNDMAVAQLEEFLRRFGIEEHLVAKEEPDGTRELYSQHDRLIPFSAACSSGTRTLLTLFLAYELRRDHTLLFFDELDAHCNYEMAEELMRYFGEQRSCQTIVTTHNTTLMSNRIMRPDCFFVLSRSGTIGSLPNLTDRELREGHNLERLYRGNAFGG